MRNWEFFISKSFATSSYKSSSSAALLSGCQAMSFSDYQDLSFDTTRKRRNKNVDSAVIDEVATD